MIPVSQPTLGSTERALVNQCLDEVRLSHGKMVERLERGLAAYLGVNHVVCTSSGTTALHLALVAAGVGPGKEVIVPDVTFVATANAVHYTGARVILADVDPNTWCIDPADVKRKITRNTAAVLPVHLYGVPCDYNGLADLGVTLIEDAAEGFGGSVGTRKLGTFGLAGTYSFFGNKVITTGEGGAVSTDFDDLAARMRFLRGQAMDSNRRYYHPEIGFNYRLTDLAAAVGVGQLQQVDKLLARRQAIVDIYRAELCYVGFTPSVLENTRHAPWLFTLQFARPDIREHVAVRLLEQGVETRPTFVPLHQLPMWRKPDALFPHACALGSSGLSLPTFPDLTFDQAHEVSAMVIRAYNEVA